MRRSALKRTRPLSPGRKGLTRKKLIQPVKTSRRRREWDRAYGSQERVEWVQAQACIVCLVVPSENMHTEGGGVSRKADADKIVPCCHGHHAIAHRKGIQTFAALYRLNLAQLAADTEAAWRMHVDGENELCVACRASFRVRDFRCVACRWDISGEDDPSCDYPAAS